MAWPFGTKSGSGAVSITVSKRIYNFNAPPSINARYKDKEVTGLDTLERIPTTWMSLAPGLTSAGFSPKAENEHRADCRDRMTWADVFPGRKPLDRLLTWRDFPIA